MGDTTPSERYGGMVCTNRASYYTNDKIGSTVIRGVVRAHNIFAAISARSSSLFAHPETVNIDVYAPHDRVTAPISPLNPYLPAAFIRVIAGGERRVHPLFRVSTMTCPRLVDLCEQTNSNSAKDLFADRAAHALIAKMRVAR
jgi:hypothetical protein